MIYITARCVLAEIARCPEWKQGNSVADDPSSNAFEPIRYLQRGKYLENIATFRASVRVMERSD